MEEKLSEQAIVDALLLAANLRKGEDKIREIVIRREGKELFSFRISPIDENIYAKCQRQNMKNRGRRNEELDNAGFICQMLYEATVPEDKKRLWNNRAVWEKYEVVCGRDVIRDALTPGEKVAAYNILEEISGYYDTDVEKDIENF